MPDRRNPFSRNDRPQQDETAHNLSASEAENDGQALGIESAQADSADGGHAPFATRMASLLQSPNAGIGPSNLLDPAPDAISAPNQSSKLDFMPDTDDADSDPGVFDDTDGAEILI